jgi:hypothetical protein
MSQKELDRAVADATGENIGFICGVGFSIADPLEVCFDPEPRWGFDVSRQVARELSCRSGFLVASEVVRVSISGFREEGHFFSSWSANATAVPLVAVSLYSQRVITYGVISRL